MYEISKNENRRRVSDESFKVISPALILLYQTFDLSPNQVSGIIILVNCSSLTAFYIGDLTSQAEYFNNGVSFPIFEQIVFMIFTIIFHKIVWIGNVRDKIKQVTKEKLSS